MKAVVMALIAFASANAPSPSKIIANIDLTKPFATGSHWRLIAIQGPPIPDPNFEDQRVPGLIELCLNDRPAPACQLKLEAMPRAPEKDLEWAYEANYLEDAKVVYPGPKSGAALLLLRTASLGGTDGDHNIFTQLVAYRPKSDRFEQIYAHDTGSNENEEVRFIAQGPLRGDVISAEPTENAPYGYWITVNQLTPTYRYKQVLRYRSATHYNDGNGLAAIDSEIPNIEQRLGLWRPGQPLPLPARRCSKPRLVRIELWCG
jgi:hypothetical protein